MQDIQQQTNFILANLDNLYKKRKQILHQPTNLLQYPFINHTIPILKNSNCVKKEKNLSYKDLNLILINVNCIANKMLELRHRIVHLENRGIILIIKSWRRDILKDSFFKLNVITHPYFSKQIKI